MGTLVSIGLANAAMAALLAALAFAASRVLRKPPVVHLLWAIVLLKLITPPLFRVDLPALSELAGWREDLAGPGAAGDPLRAGAPLPAGEPSRSIDHPVETVPSAGAHAVSEVRRDEPLEMNRRVQDFPAGEVSVRRAAGASRIDPGLEPAPAIERGDGEGIEGDAREIAVLAQAPVAASDVVRPAPLQERFPSKSLGVMDVLGAVWFSGSVLWFLLAASRMARFRRLLSCARAASPELDGEVRRVAERLGLRRAPDVRVIRARISPLVWTFSRRPRIVLPEELLASLSASQRRTLIAHELAHLRRRDHWLRSLEVVSVGLYWWFPVAWWARRELREAEEECCDAWVRWAFPDRARDYAATLLSTVDFLSENPVALPEGASGMGQVSLLRRRFHMILVRRPSHRLSGAARAAIVSVGALALSWTVGVPAQEVPGETSEDDGGDRGVESAPEPTSEDGGRAVIAPGAGVKAKRVGSGARARRVGATTPAEAKGKEGQEAVPADEASGSGPSREPSPPDREIDARVRALQQQLRRLELELDVLRAEEENAREAYRRAKRRYAQTTDQPVRVIEGRFLAEGRSYDVRVEGNVVMVSDPESGETLWTTVLAEDMSDAVIRGRNNNLQLSTPERTIVLDVTDGKVVTEVVPRRFLPHLAGGESTGADQRVRNAASSRRVRRSKTPTNVPVAITGRAGALPGGLTLGGAAGSGAAIDVVELANALIEAEGALELAKVRRGRLARKVESGAGDRGELQAAEVEIETAHRKVELFRRMAQSTLKWTRVEMEHLHELEETTEVRYRSGQATQEALIDAKVRRARAEMLKDLLEHILESSRE